MSSGSNGVSMWLCPLCQQGQPDRDGLSLHLTGKHSVLPACLDKLLDIVGHMIIYFTCLSSNYVTKRERQIASLAIAVKQIMHLYVGLCETRCFK